jgi:membrane protease YdiL (CAAX protease family)
MSRIEATLPSATPNRPMPGSFWITSAWAAAVAGLWVLASLATVLIAHNWGFTAIGFEQVAVSVLGSLMILPLIIGAVRNSGAPWRDDLALRAPEWIDILIGFACVLLLIGGYAALSALTGENILARAPDLYLVLAASGMLVPFVLCAVVLAPVMEEIVFRGFLYRGWSRSAVGVAGAIVLTSALWALMHTRLGTGGMAIMFGVGLMLGTVRWLSGSTTLVIGIHAINNVHALAQLFRGNETL